ncbi:MAG: M14 family metallopeptidase [Methylococcales bacterium]|nr:M14 family metallopeptidase [Methylococcales bacterium]
MHLKQLDYLPEGLLEVSSKELRTILPEPTLIHLSGKHTAPLFVSVLLHGNEPTGFLAIQSLLKKYQDKELPRSLSVFFGNVAAASHDLRRLDKQPDYNRIWPGTELPDSAETQMAQEIVAIMKKRNVFASVDVHNNTGLNPHYACINNLDNKFLQLASLFGRLIVYFIRPKGVQSAAFAQICPAVTLECGRPDQKLGMEHALEFLNCCLRLTELPQHQILAKNIDLFHTVAQVKINDKISFSFNNVDTDLLLKEDLERMNFNEVSPGTVMGTCKNDAIMPLVAMNEYGNDVTDDFFSIQNGELQINRLTMPSMLTLNEDVIRQDCLCYLMERM